MMLSDSDEFWIEQVLRPIALLPVPKDADDADVVASIWSNRRFADDRQQHTITAREVRDARRIYERVSAWIAPTPKGDFGMSKTTWGAARIEVDDLDPSDVVLMVEGEFAGNVGARVQQVGRVFDVDKDFAHEMARRWNLVANLKEIEK